MSNVCSSDNRGYRTEIQCQRCNLSPLQFYTFTANVVNAIGEGNKHVPHIGEDVYSWSAESSCLHCEISGRSGAA